jgi:hypothetical protein
MILRESRMRKSNLQAILRRSIIDATHGMLFGPIHKRLRLVMRKVISICLLAMSIIVVAASCTVSSPVTSEPMSPLPTIRPAADAYVIYTSTLNLSDGRVLPVQCIDYVFLNIDTECTATFPNGNVMGYVEPRDFSYSPDQKFAVRKCVRTTFDSSCLNGLQVWDMTNGIYLGGFQGYSWYEWVPNEPHTFAFIEPNGPQNLTFWDLGTGKKQYPKICPEWLNTDNIQAVNSREVIAFCKYASSPKATP